MKKVEERTTPDLLELTLQLHSRALNQPNNKEMHDAYVEARQELEKRLPANENAVLRSVSNRYYEYDGDCCTCKRPIATPPQHLRKGQLSKCGICRKPFKRQIKRIMVANVVAKF